MNSNHAYQYSCSPEHEPNTEEHQVLGKTEPLRDDMQAQKRITKNLNKYIYPEFNGFEGEKLLKECVAAVLPLALYRTWEATMSFGGEKPWVGTERISQRASVTQRKIQMDLKELENLGLLEIRVGYETKVVNDKIEDYRAEYKDFSKLYDLAHEYNQWKQSRTYLIYQPTFADCMRLREKHDIYVKMKQDDALFQEIVQDPARRDDICTAEEIYKSLLRFHNYRRLLTQKLKPSKSEKSLGGVQAHDGHLLHKTKNSDLFSSSYESILNSNNSDSIDSNLTQDKFIVTQVSPLTRRDEGEYPQSERDTHVKPEDFTMGSGKGAEEYSFEIPPAQGNISQREPNFNRKGNVPRDAKEISAQQKSDTFISEVLSESRRKKDTSAKERYNRWAEAEELRRENRSLANLMSHIVDEFNQPEKSKRSMETFVLNLQKSSQMTEEEFRELVYYVRANVMSKPDSTIKARYMGKANRAPLFMSDMKRGAEKGMQYLVDEKERRAQIKAIGQIQEPVAEIDQEVVNQVVDEIIRPSAEASYQIQQEIMVKVEPVEAQPVKYYMTMQNVAEEAMAIQDDEWKRVRADMKTVLGIPVLPGTACKCGCRAVVMVNFKKCCPVCEQPANWTEQKREQVKQIAASAWTIGECTQEVYRVAAEQGIDIVTDAMEA